MEIEVICGEVAKKHPKQLAKFGITYFRIEARYNITHSVKVRQHYVAKPTRKQLREFKKEIYAEMRGRNERN